MTAKIHGRLGAVDLAATTNTTAYTVPASRKATCGINICNRNASSITFRLAHIDGALGSGTYERTGITMTATHTLMVYASGTGASAVVTGVEEDV